MGKHFYENCILIMNKIIIGSVKSITLKEIMKMRDAEMNVVCDALFNDDYNDDWFEQARSAPARMPVAATVSS